MSTFEGLSTQVLVPMSHGITLYPLDPSSSCQSVDSLTNEEVGTVAAEFGMKELKQRA